MPRRRSRSSWPRASASAAAQREAVLLGQVFRQDRDVRVAGRALEKEERARDDAQRLLDAVHDGLHDLLARTRGREVARDVEQGAAGAIRVVVLDPLEHVRDPLLDGHEQRGEHDA